MDILQKTMVEVNITLKDTQDDPSFHPAQCQYDEYCQDYMSETEAQYVQHRDVNLNSTYIEEGESLTYHELQAVQQLTPQPYPQAYYSTKAELQVKVEGASLADTPDPLQHTAMEPCTAGGIQNYLPVTVLELEESATASPPESPLLHRKSQSYRKRALPVPISDAPVKRVHFSLLDSSEEETSSSRSSEVPEDASIELEDMKNDLTHFVTGTPQTTELRRSRGKPDRALPTAEWTFNFFIYLLTSPHPICRGLVTWMQNTGTEPCSTPSDELLFRVIDKNGVAELWGKGSAAVLEKQLHSTWDNLTTRIRYSSKKNHGLFAAARDIPDSPKKRMLRFGYKADELLHDIRTSPSAFHAKCASSMPHLQDILDKYTNK